MIWTLAAQIGKIQKYFEDRKLRKKSSGKKRALPGHTLYHFQLSPFSRNVRVALNELGLEIPQKDILLDEQAFRDLRDQGGKDRSPCLRIDGPKGTQWMYESSDIIAYLKKQTVE